jgi:hypothetical protein
MKPQARPPAKSPAKSTPKPNVGTLDLAIGLALILAAFLVYAQVGTFDFTSYDDPLYVTDNTHVQAGLTLESIKWATVAVVASNWMPVTLLSHMLDCELFHLQSGMHHLTNVFLHLLASLLLFATLKRATGARWPSAFVAMIFALHPLHVESVAWVAERKDVLSACFFFLALYAYVRYAEQPSLSRYLSVAALFSLGLMAKPMLVTFPFVLLLFDVWPLRRLLSRGALWARQQAVLDKLPLLALSAIISIVTFNVQRSTQAVQSFPLPVRIENALIAYVAYIGQMFWPTGLAVLYPYNQSPALWEAAAALVVILAVSAAVIWFWRTRPYLPWAGSGFWVRWSLSSVSSRSVFSPMLTATCTSPWLVS